MARPIGISTPLSSVAIPMPPDLIEPQCDPTQASFGGVFFSSNLR